MNLKLFVDSDDQELKNLYKDAVTVHNDKMLSPFPDAGFDLFTPVTTLCDGDGVNKINFLVKCSATRDTVTTGYYMYPRSSLSKTPLRLANSVGIIDSGYRGNLIGAFDCICTGEPYLLTQYSKLLQICSPTLEPIYVTIVDTVEELGLNTERGEGGFGSTGK
jgi:dUTP pyrophosphatase